MNRSAIREEGAKWGKLSTKLTFANVMSVIAVFIALGGIGYATLKLPKNSVGRKQIKPNAVNSSKVKDGAPDRR